MNIFNLLFIFALFSVIGWIGELFYTSIFDKKRLINPGFLSGPYLPIYGFGFTTLYLLAEPNIPDYIKIPLFVIAATLLELITGFIFLKIFHLRLWNYENRKFNYKGLICFYFSFYWLVISLIFYYLIYPKILKLILGINKSYLIYTLLGFFYGLLIEDLIISFDIASKLKRGIREFTIRQSYLLNIKIIELSQDLKTINFLVLKQQLLNQLKYFWKDKNYMKYFNPFIHSHHFDFRESIERYFEKIKNRDKPK